MGAELTPRVFVANFAGHDYKDAKSYGEITFIVKGFISFQTLERVKYAVAEGIPKTRPDDWLLISGATIINIIAALFWIEKHGVVKLLNYDKKESVYRELILTRDNIKDLFSVLEAV